MIFVKAFVFSILFFNLALCAVPTAYFSILLRRPSLNDTIPNVPTTDLLHTLAKERSIARSKDYLKFINISNLSQLPNLMEGIKSLISLWVADLDSSQTRFAFNVTKLTSGFILPGKFICSFSAEHWGHFYLLSVFAKVLWATIIYSLESISSPFLELL